MAGILEFLANVNDNTLVKAAKGVLTLSTLANKLDQQFNIKDNTLALVPTQADAIAAWERATKRSFKHAYPYKEHNPIWGYSTTRASRALVRHSTLWTPTTGGTTDPTKMPRFLRKRKRKSRGKRSKPAKRRRRLSRKFKRRKRTRRVALSTRMMPLTKTMKFTMVSQIKITTKSAKWGVIRFPVNTMEKPLAYNQLSDPGLGLHQLHFVAYGDAKRTPIGQSRWLGEPTTPGKYNRYMVKDTKITLSHLPGIRSETDVNLIGGTVTYHGMPVSHSDATATEIPAYFDSFDEGDLGPVLSKTGPLKQVRMFNRGGSGQSWVIHWNEKTNRKKFKHYRQHNTTASGDVGENASLWIEGVTHSPIAEGNNFPLVTAFFALGMLADQATVDLTFLVKFDYIVEMTNPTNYDADLVDDNAGVFQEFP